MIRVRDLGTGDTAWKQEALVREWGATVVARRGELVDALALDGFVASAGEERIGLLTYASRADGFEVVTIQVDRPGIGAGRALMNAALVRATELGVHRMWLSTTNANRRAIDFYRRWGMRLCVVVAGGVAASRAVKPSIPLLAGGVPIRDELEFERLTSPGSPHLG